MWFCSSASRPSLGFAGILLLSFGLIGCQEQANVYAPPPPPEVSVSHPAREDVLETLVYTGEVRGLEIIEIRARVQGFIQEIHFRSGSDVFAGDKLFTIDPREFEANLKKAKAELASAQALEQLAAVERAKSQALLRRDATTETEVRQRDAEYRQAQARVALAQAQLENAQLDLEYTQVTAPSRGRINENQVDVGALVGAGEPTLLATLIRRDEVYVDFNIPQPDLIEFTRRNPEAVRPLMSREEEQAREQIESSVTKVYAIRQDDTELFEGRFDSADNTVDPRTSTIKARARFPNPTGQLFPGLFVRVQIPLEQTEALLIPAVAVAADLAGRYVLVIDDENQVERRSIVTGTRRGDLQEVVEGLTEDDLLIVNGLQRARPGVTVQPTEIEIDTSSLPKIDGAVMSEDSRSADDSADFEAVETTPATITTDS